MGVTDDTTTRARALADRVFAAVFAVYAGALAIWLVMGLLPAAAAAIGPLHGFFADQSAGHGWLARTSTRIIAAARAADSPVRVVSESWFSVLNAGLGILLVVRRPRDPVSRLLAFGMIGTAATFNHQSHSVFTYDLLGAPGVVALLHRLFHVVSGVAYVYAVVVFPDGRLVPVARGRRHRVVVAVYAAATLAIVQTSLQATGSGHPGQRFFVHLFGVLIPLAGVAAQTYRLRRPIAPEARQQARVLRWALLPTFVAGLVFAVLPSVIGTAETQRLGLALFPSLFAVVPLALFLGILRYHLWDIDLVVNRALLYGALGTFIGAVYVGMVVGLSHVVGAGEGNPLLAIGSLAVTAVAFEPVRRRAQVVANRLVYGARTPPDVLIVEVTRRRGQTSNSDDALAELSAAAAAAVPGAAVDIWLAVGDRLVVTDPSRDQASTRSVPLALPATSSLAGALEATYAVPVSDLGELLGAIAVVRRAGEPVLQAEARLLADLAAHAGVVLRNVRLRAELAASLARKSAQARAVRESRQHIVAREDAERRRIERDIHDGAQQHLVALAVQLRLVRSVLAQDPGQARILATDALDALNDAIGTVRSLARGISPTLRDGVVPAITAHARRLKVPVRITAREAARHAPDIEAAVYFTCAEALQNITKHAAASRVEVDITADDAGVKFRVADDGTGFDATEPSPGSGLANMHDRVVGIGGALAVLSTPGTGTVVEGHVPAPGLGS